MFVANAVERRQHVGGKPAGLFQHGRGDIAVEIPVMTGLPGSLQSSAVVEGEQHVVDRCTVGHGIKASRRAKTKPSSHETMCLSTFPSAAVRQRDALDMKGGRIARWDGGTPAAGRTQYSTG